VLRSNSVQAVSKVIDLYSFFRSSERVILPGQCNSNLQILYLILKDGTSTELHRTKMPALANRKR
jgi:hypothetical protein